MWIGKSIIRLEEVDSTNRYLMDLLPKSRPVEGTVVTTGFQTAGRGMDKNPWESETGKNLLFSLVLYPDYLPADRQFLLNKAVSLALHDFLAGLLDKPTELKVKWPNDLYFGNRKIAGVLIQNGIKGDRFDYSVIGIGMNINQESYKKYPVPAVSLKMITALEYELEGLLQSILENLEIRIGQLKQGRFDILYRDYIQSLFRFGEEGDYLFEGKEIRARITGIDEYGQLLLMLADGQLLTCDLKQVKFMI